jgi:FlaA1/EpsC-like NDP-sugar epimerase
MTTVRSSRLLAQFALRLCHTAANAVASERAFSAWSLQHTKIRNRLDAGRVDKLVYIHMNRRALSEVEEFEDEDQRERQQLEWEDEEIERLLHRSRVLGIGSKGSNLGKRSRSLDDI